MNMKVLSEYLARVTVTKVIAHNTTSLGEVYIRGRDRRDAKLHFPLTYWLELGEWLYRIFQTPM